MKTVMRPIACVGNINAERFKSRTAALAIALAGAFAGLTGCGDGTDAEPVTALRFVDDPSELVAGQQFDLSVELIGSGGDRSTESGRRVSLSLAGGGQLSGPVTVTASGGVARFDDLAITTAGEAVRINGMAGSLSAATSAFRVRFATPSAVRSSFFPDSIVFTPDTPAPIEFTFTDAYGNPVAGQPVALTSSLGGSTFSPASGVTNDDGIFATTFSATATGKATLAATIGGSALTFPGHLAATEFCAPITMSVPGNATGTIPIDTCEASGRPAAVYRFTKSGGGGVSFSAVPSGFAARVEVKTSLNEPTVAIAPTPTIPGAEWLLPDGTYLYRISSLSATGHGSYSITASPIAATSGVTTRFIVAPGTYTGQSLSPADRQFGDGTLYDYFVLFSNRSCTITMSSTAFDAFLWIDDAVQLVTVDGSDNDGGGTDARVVRNPCSTSGNPIGILANSNPGPNGTTPVGSYTLTIEYGPPVPALMGGLRPVAVRSDTARRDFPGMIRDRREAARRR
jgi:hypothetical protein